jgi:hypothetical protein
MVKFFEGDARLATKNIPADTFKVEFSRILIM